MTDENGLTPARPVAPRHRLPANPQMAQPMSTPPQPAAQTQLPIEPALEPDQEWNQERELTESTATQPEPETEPGAELLEPEPASAAPSDAQPEQVVEVANAPAGASGAEPAAPEFDFPKTMRATLAKVDQSWATFRSAAMRFPSERMDERLGEDGWTRKQMLEHIAAWHDLTADRMIVLINTGEPAPLDRDTDQFNAAIARRAVGKSAGEVLGDMDATFNRLRRQMARLSDAQLQIGEWWAAYVIGGNTYGHYEEHWADIYTPELPAGGARSRR